MRQPLLMLTAAASLVASALVSAGENYNYSHFTIGAGFGNTEIGGLKIDDTSWYARAAYELESLPLVLETGYAYTSINDDELASDSDMDQSTYFIGTSFIISPTDRLDILPGIAIGRANTTLNVGSSEAKADVTSYTASIDVRFHLERGLWLTTGYAYQDYDEELLDSTNFFEIGAEYIVDADWALGLNYLTNSDSNSTRLFAKVFY